MFPSSKNFKIPVIFHNLKYYDAHLIITELGTLKDVVHAPEVKKEKGDLRSATRNLTNILG